MVDVGKIAQQIEIDENSVRDSGSGRGRLLDDLRTVPNDQVRDVFNRVYADDVSLNKTTMIDISNGLLIITNPYRSSLQGTAGNRAAESTAAPAPAKESFLHEVKEIHDSMPWYERIMIWTGAMYELKQIDDMVKKAIDRHQD